MTLTYPLPDRERKQSTQSDLFFLALKGRCHWHTVR